MNLPTAPSKILAVKEAKPSGQHRTLSGQASALSRSTCQATVNQSLSPSSILAIKEAKPNGQHKAAHIQVERYLLDLAVDELPGVGWNICQKLKELNIESVRGIRASSKEALQREVGNKTGLPADANSAQLTRIRIIILILILILIIILLIMIILMIITITIIIIIIIRVSQG